MIKEILKFLMEYETFENNSQRLNKGYNQKLFIRKIWNVLYE